MHVAALASLLVLIWIGYRYSWGRGAPQQLVPALRELNEAWRVAPHRQRKLALVTIVVTLLGIVIGLSFVSWRAVPGGTRQVASNSSMMHVK
jgi:hypothetical protein